MVKYDLYIYPREGDEAITYFDITAKKVDELYVGLPSDNFMFVVREEETAKEVEYPFPKPKETED